MIFHQMSNSRSNFSYNTALYTDRGWEHHFHENPELIYVLEGAVRCSIGGKEHLLTEGDFGLCLPYDIHSYVPQDHTKYWVLVFSMEYIRYLEKDFSGKTGTGFSFRCPKSVEDYLYASLVQVKHPTVLTLKSCLYAICQEYLRQIPLTEKNTADLRSAAFIAQYIEDNHTERPSLSDLAEKLGYDYSYMSRYFHSTFHMSFPEFVNIYRLETARKLLEDPTVSIAQAALDSGFQSIRSFNSIFRKSMGQSPSEYRKASRR